MNPFLDWLREVKHDSLVVETSEAGLQAEALGNLWTFSLSPQQAQSLLPKDVLQFFEAVLTNRERQITERFEYQHPMVFYCWFDEPSAQLRFSLVSAVHDRLPFECPIHLVDDLAEIIQPFLSSAYHVGIPTEEFGTEVLRASESISVWMKRIPT